LYKCSLAYFKPGIAYLSLAFESL